MSLSLYRKKRDFSETPEPEGKEKSSKKNLRFVVQMHNASQLHYDFRLEMGGVLKSWAIPKGPSLNPANKRLAMMVEDHPYEYINFEGVIPEDNYGAGTVIVWDEGTYTPENAEGLPLKEQEQLLLGQLAEGNLKFVLHGKKLKGLFTLFRLKKGDENAWLLVKKKDKFSGTGDVTKQEASVKSGKTIAQIAKAYVVDVKSEEDKKHAAAKGIKKITNAPEKGPDTKGKKQKSEKADIKSTRTKPASPSEKIKKSSLFQLHIEEGKEQEVTINNHLIKVTNLDKLYWRKESITKGDMLNYYLRISPYLFPYMKDRPQSLHRYPDGVGGTSFFQKDVEGKVPEWVPTHEDFSESTHETVHYLVCSDEAALLYMANLGCIEMHPWHSRVQSPAFPDYCLIDLDPDNNNSFDEVVETALVVKSLLDDVGVASYPKTSGSTGLHIYIPLGAQYVYDQSRQLAELIVHLTNKELPSLTSIERNPDKRKGKIYLDFLQNSQTKTAAAPYSLRPKEGAPVSAPLDWSEVKKGLIPTTYNLYTIFDRLKSVGDLFQPVLGKGISLEKVLPKIETLAR